MCSHISVSVCSQNYQINGQYGVIGFWREIKDNVIALPGKVGKQNVSLLYALEIEANEKPVEIRKAPSFNP